MEVFIAIALFFVILTILVLVHEIGHFVTARIFGIHAEEFGIGLPPRMFGVRKGKTLFSLNWIPLGGFVKIKGEQGDHTDDEDSFSNKPIWQRGVVLSAGVCMNIVLASILLMVGFIIGTPQIITDDISAAAAVRNQKIQISYIEPSSPASKSTVKRGDSLQSIDGIPATSVKQVQEYIAEKTGIPIEVIVYRNNTRITESIIPELDENFGRAILGVELIPTGIVSYPLTLALPLGIQETGILLKEIILAFAKVISDIFTDEKIRVDLSGPVGIAVITSEVSKLGMPYIIQFAALLSLNLAIINFIPFPALDGGRFLFLMIERIRGSSVNQKIESMSHTVGFALLMILIIIVTYRDIQKYQGIFSGFWDRFTGLFS